MGANQTCIIKKKKENKSPQIHMSRFVQNSKKDLYKIKTISQQQTVQEKEEQQKQQQQSDSVDKSDQFEMSKVYFDLYMYEEKKKQKQYMKIVKAKCQNQNIHQNQEKKKKKHLIINRRVKEIVDSYKQLGDFDMIQNDKKLYQKY